MKSQEPTYSNLAVVYDFGRTPGGYYLARELVRGPSLAALRRIQAGPPPASDAGG